MNALVILLLIFVLLMLLVAGKDGLKNLIGLGLNFLMIFILITVMAWGFPILIVLPILSFAIMAFSIFMSTPDEKTASTAFKSSSIVLAGLMFLAVLIQYIGQFQGFVKEDAEALEALSADIGINFSNIVIAVFIISLLGAVAEAAMAIVTNLNEVIEQDELMTSVQFKNQRRIISQQIIGTAVNTLFFGMLGSSLGLILWYIRLHFTVAEILNSKLLLMELATMLLGLLGILLVIELAGYFVEKDFLKSEEVL
ncbi:YibE/F family protein [Lactovum odontotermitis]